MLFSSASEELSEQVKLAFKDVCHVEVGQCVLRHTTKPFCSVFTIKYGGGVIVVFEGL